MKTVLPYEITKLFEIDKETGLVDTSKNYAMGIEENFKTIIKYFNDLISGTNIKLDQYSGDYIEVKDGQETPITRVKIGKIGTEIDEYGLAIYDESGNLLINLYDPGNYEIKKPVKIASAYDSGWVAVPSPGSYKILTHNLGYYPSVNLLWSGNANPPTLIFDESFWLCLYTGWISTTQIEIMMAEATDPELTPVFKTVLFR